MIERLNKDQILAAVSAVSEYMAGPFYDAPTGLHVAIAALCVASLESIPLEEADVEAAAVLDLARAILARAVVELHREHP